MSFKIPGLEAPLEGTWITVDQDNANEKTKEAFARTHLAVKDAHEHRDKSLPDTFLEMVEMLD